METNTNQVASFDGVNWNAVPSGGNLVLHTTSSTTPSLTAASLWVVSGTTTATATLPDATLTPGTEILVFNNITGNHAITFNTVSSQTVNGGASGTKADAATRYCYTRLVSDGANWFAFGGAGL